MSYGQLGDIFYPINMKGRMFIIDKTGERPNEELFAAVVNGYKIDLSQTVGEEGKSKFVEV